MKNYTISAVSRALNLKASCRVDESDRIVRVAAAQTDLGLKSWGKIDFLVNHCGFRLLLDNRDAKRA